MINTFFPAPILKPFPNTTQTHQNAKPARSGFAAALLLALTGLVAHASAAPQEALRPSGSANANSAATSLVENAGSAEDRFIAARNAFRDGERGKLALLADSLLGTPFHGWAQFWQLKLGLEESSVGVPEFLEREGSSYLAEKLRLEWLKQLGKQAQWATFKQQQALLLDPNADQEVACYTLQARLLADGDAGALDAARPLWFSVMDMPDACMPLMVRLIASGKLSPDDVWWRIRRLMEGKKPNTAKALLAYLPATQTVDSHRLDAAVSNPARFLAKLPKDLAGNRPQRELALIAVARMARNDPNAAAGLWSGHEENFKPDERAYAWGQIGWQAAQRHLPQAVDWYARSNAGALNEEQMAWHARAAMRAENWRQLAKAIGDMPAKMASQPDWTYWLGRALAAQGRKDEAKELYQKISNQSNFYGNLALEELGSAIDVPPKASPPTAAELAKVEAMPGLKRALAVLDTELRIEGVREWVWNLRGMNDRELLAVAEMANRHAIWDRAINTSDRTVAEHNYSLRYLAPFREQVTEKVRGLSLDPSWVYGLMRQESRFVMNAKSTVGAKGLMQLMPATARFVARKIGMSDFSQDQVTDLDTNITLGSNYLKMVLDSLGNDPVLASAAYNAGPGRARKWMAGRPMEGAIYAENIPFNETRDYVKRVMSNAVYYAALFEKKPQSLKARMGVVRPLGALPLTGEDAELP